MINDTERFNSLLDLLNEAYFELDLKYNITIMNQKGYELFEFSDDEQLNLYNLISDKFHSVISNDINNLLTLKSKNIYRECLGLTSRGKLIPLILQLIVRYENDIAVGFIGLTLNLSTQRKLETQLRNAQKMEAIGTMATSIFHDLNNIFQIILGHVQILKLENEDEKIEVIMDHIRKGIDLINMMHTNVVVKSFDNSKFILIVDDERYMLKLMDDILTKADFNVIKASSGESALEVYNDVGDNISLVVLDLMMPGMDGWEVLEELLKVDETVKVLITSSSDSIAESLNEGATAILKKPYLPEKLIEKVNDILKGG